MANSFQKMKMNRSTILEMRGESSPFVYSNDNRCKTGSNRTGDILDGEEFAPIGRRDDRPSARFNRNMER